MDDHTRTTITQLEESLWRMETRSNAALMRKTFADDCFEYGQSGRIFLLEDLIFEDGGPEFVAILPLENFCLQYLASDVVHATYVSEVTINGTTERTNRSSIWSNQDGGAWRLRFHQGTKVPSR